MGMDHLSNSSDAFCARITVLRSPPRPRTLHLPCLQRLRGLFWTATYLCRFFRFTYRTCLHTATWHRTRLCLPHTPAATPLRWVPHPYYHRASAHTHHYAPVLRGRAPVRRLLLPVPTTCAYAARPTHRPPACLYHCPSTILLCATTAAACLPRGYYLPGRIISSCHIHHAYTPFLTTCPPRHAHHHTRPQPFPPRHTGATWRLWHDAPRPTTVSRC